MSAVYTTLDDGTRVYRGGARYKPKELHERKIGINRPDDPRAVRFHARWFVPVDTLDDGDREMPETRSDTEAYDHMENGFSCACTVCKRPESERWKRRWLRVHGLRS